MEELSGNQNSGLVKEQSSFIQGASVPRALPLNFEP